MARISHCGCCVARKSPIAVSVSVSGCVSVSEPFPRRAFDSYPEGISRLKREIAVSESIDGVEMALLMAETGFADAVPTIR